ncbi:MAG: glycosyltransferase [Thiotrichales bacterium]|nr:glycosyltransferase [Thiotrichales bacterium]
MLREIKFFLTENSISDTSNFLKRVWAEQNGMTLATSINSVFETLTMSNIDRKAIISIVIDKLDSWFEISKELIDSLNKFDINLKVQLLGNNYLNNINNKNRSLIFFFDKNTNSSSTKLENHLFQLEKKYPNEEFFLISNVPALSFRKAFIYIYYQNNLQSIPKDFIEKDRKKIFILGEYKERVASCLFKEIATSTIPSLLTLDNTGNVVELKKTGSSKGLFIFPDRMLPAQRAFQARGLDLVNYLNRINLGLDVLVFGPKNNDLSKIKTALNSISPNVHVTSLLKGKSSGFYRAIRFSEKLIRRFGFMLEKSPPITFKQRSDMLFTDENVNFLESVISKGNYDFIIVTGSWFYPIIERLQNKHRIKIICDTHDVFFLSDEHVNSYEKRFFYNSKNEKRRELKYLNAFDHVVAISKSDKEVLEENNVKNVLVATGGFEYAYLPVTDLENKNQFFFGFIGTGNNNNQIALNHMKRTWLVWILEKNPLSQILLAGAICKTELAQELAQNYPQNIRLLGFIDNLSDYYNAIDIALSPIMMQGGLNFKTVESLMAGKPVITSEIGARCVAGCFGVYEVETKKSFDSVYKLLEGYINGWTEFSCQIQQQAVNDFNQESGFNELVKVIESIDTSK